MKAQHYSLEIQGLRGISILAVMLFHFGGIPLPGGYAGVDMFFVISGYVITQLIIREHQAGVFTLGRFYKNRVIRLLPNLFLMIAASVAIAYALLKPYDFMQFGKSLQFTAVYLTNMVFARQQGYFDLSREVKPLLHTWSLSIEEQFYLFFPLLLILLWRFHYRRWIIFGGLLLASLGWKVWVTEQDAIAGFFSFPGRIWEFMIGALAAQAPVAFRQRVGQNEALSVLSIIVVLATFIFLDERIAYSGLWVGGACLATAILILSSRGTRTGQLLSGKQLVFIGALSYSLYLWHWPLLVMLRNIEQEIPILLQLPILAALTFVVAYLAWRFVEAPLHHNKNRYTGKQVGAVLAVFFVFVVAVGGYVYAKAGMEERFPHWVKVRQNLQAFDFAKAVGRPLMPLADCNLPGPANQSLSSCAMFGDKQAKEKFLVIGDSHVGVWYPAFDYAARETHRMGIYSSLPGCPPILGVHSIDVDKNICETDVENKLAQLIAHFQDIKTVYLIAHWDMYAEGHRIKGVLQRPSMLVSDDEIESFEAAQSKRVIERAFRRTAEFYRQRGIKVVVVFDVPTLPVPIQSLPDDYVVSLETYQAQGRFMRDMIERLKGEGLQVQGVDPGVILCETGSCQTKSGDNYLYQDDNHISAAGAAKLSKFVKGVFDGR